LGPVAAGAEVGRAPGRLAFGLGSALGLRSGAGAGFADFAAGVDFSDGLAGVESGAGGTPAGRAGRFSLRR